jgi:Lrp/AsnC family leucine-responsive transcriptional regulator
MTFESKEIDGVDRLLLQRLSTDGRATWADLAHDFDLTAPAIAQRVRRLQERGIIRRFAAILDPDLLAPVIAYVAVRLIDPDLQDDFEAFAREREWIHDCVRVAGENDYLLKIRCESLPALDRLATEISRLPGVHRTSTTIALSTVKEGIDARNATAH